MKRNVCNFLIPAAAILVSVLALWGPERLAEYRDGRLLNRVVTVKMEQGNEGYRYAMSSNEKVYVLSKCLNSQVLPESEQSAKTGLATQEYESPAGTYAFVVNREGPSGREITKEEIYHVCNSQIEALHEQGILSGKVKPVTTESHTAVLYSAIDVLEPRNNLSVWKVSLATNVHNPDKANQMVDMCVDADTGKFYEFYVRTESKWEEMDVDRVMEAWASYLELSGIQAYEEENPLLETATDYRKYSLPGQGEEKTIATAGFYEGINEFFIKISR